MKVAPTLDGRIRIDVESELDLMVLRSIRDDAERGDPEARLRQVMRDSEAQADWEEFVLPELRTTFEHQLERIDRSLRGTVAGEGVPVFIDREHAEAWYGGLNQARLVLEEHHGLAEADPEELEPAARSAWYRSQFYLQLQSLLLQFLMRD